MIAGVNEAQRINLGLGLTLLVPLVWVAYLAFLAIKFYLTKGCEYPPGTLRAEVELLIEDTHGSRNPRDAGIPSP
jgi:hypothetical protein